MADNEKPIDSLLEKIDDYVKTSIELAKYKAIDIISDVIGALIPYLFESLLIWNCSNRSSFISAQMG